MSSNQSKKFVFTNSAIAKLPPLAADSKSRADEYSDVTVQGLRALVNKKAAKGFAFRYTLASGQTRYAKIGSFPAIGVPEARAAALEMRAIVDRGGDPLEARDRQKAMPLFREFFLEEYYPYAVQVKRSAHDDETKFRLHLDKKFGDRRLCDITTRDIQLYHAAIKQSHSAGYANRHLALLSGMFRRAMEWGRVDRNPATGVKQFKEDNQQQTFLTPADVARLISNLANDPNKAAVAALTLLLLTGVRREEALQAEWQYVNLETGHWWLPKTKSGRGRWVTLSAEAKALIAAQPSQGVSPWVFPGRDGEKPINNVRKTLERGLAAAGLQHVRIHDLRHTFASMAVGAGATLYEVQNLLGHANSHITQRYAHLADTGLRRATQSVADAVSRAVRVAAQDDDAAAEAA